MPDTGSHESVKVRSGASFDARMPAPVVRLAVRDGYLIVHMTDGLCAVLMADTSPFKQAFLAQIGPASKVTAENVASTMSLLRRWATKARGPAHA